MFKTIPAAAHETISAVPPWLTNGNGKPVSGKTLSIEPIFTKACPVISITIPSTVSLEKTSGAFFAIINPRSAKSTKRVMRRTPPTKPNSSEKTEKMESLMGSGRKLNFWTLCPNPRPKNSPEPIAINDC